MESNNSTTNTFRDYIRVLFRHKLIILLCPIVVVISVYVGLELKTPVYESKVKILISAEKQVESPYYREIEYRNVQVALTQSEIVKSSPVIERAVQTLQLYKRPLDYEKQFASRIKNYFLEKNIDKTRDRLLKASPEQIQSYLFFRAVNNLRNSISVAPIRDTNMFTITVKDFNPVTATVLANVVSRSYIVFDLEQQLAELSLKYGQKHPMVKQIKDSVDRLSNNLNSNPVSYMDAIGPASVKIIEQASIPIEPTGVPKKPTLILALVMGIFLGIVMAFIFDYMDQGFRSPHDIERILEVPVLGFIPRKSFLRRAVIRNIKRKHLYARSFQGLSDQLYLSIKNKNIKALLIGEVLRRQGAAVTVANLAQYLTQKFSKKILIVDANLRTPSMHKLFKRTNVYGLAQVLEGKISAQEAIQTVQPLLDLMAAGRTELNAMSLLDSPNFQTLLKELKEKYAVILFDCVDLRSFKDSLILATHMDGVAFVLKQGRIRRQVVKSLLAPLKTKPNFLGVILNNRSFDIPGFIYERI